MSKFVFFFVHRISSDFHTVSSDSVLIRCTCVQLLCSTSRALRSSLSQFFFLWLFQFSCKCHRQFCVVQSEWIWHSLSYFLVSSLLGKYLSIFLCYHSLFVLRSPRGKLHQLFDRFIVYPTSFFVWLMRSFPLIIIIIVSFSHQH